MPKSILYEADNLTLSHGTGIATYAKNLAKTARALGYVPSALVNARRPLSKRDSLLSEISFFDAQADGPRPISQTVGLGRFAVFGAPFGVPTVPLPLAKTVIAPAGDRFANFDGVLTVTDLSEKAGLHFKRYGAPLKIKPPTQPDLFHATQAIPLRVARAPNIYTVHDIVPLRLPYTTLDQKKYVLNVLRDIARRADHIVTVSEHSRRDIIDVLGVNEDRVTNTYQAVSLPRELVAKSADVIAREIEGQFSLDHKGYFLFVGAFEPKKNVGRLIDAFASSGTTRPLVIVGSDGWGCEPEIRRLGDEQFLRYQMSGNVITASRRIRRLPYVPFASLISLIRGARALVFPSLYEGFGLPVLEAMSLGTPVITSNVASLPEIAGEAALLIDPTDVQAMTRAIQTLDADDDLCAELSRRGPIQAEKFSPAAYAERVQALYSKLM